MSKIYIAYGSNLNKEQMAYRCPTARFLGTGVIEDYELQFKGSLHSAFATIAPKEGAQVPVGLWEIQSRDEKRLDLYPMSQVSATHAPVAISYTSTAISASGVNDSKMAIKSLFFTVDLLQKLTS